MNSRTKCFDDCLRFVASYSNKRRVKRQRPWNQIFDDPTRVSTAQILGHHESEIDVSSISRSAAASGTSRP